RTHRFVHGAALPILRHARSWPVASTVAIVAMVWLSPEQGPLAMFRSLFPFEILIVTGAIVGLLGGIAWAVRSAVPPGRRRTALIGVAIVPAMVVGTAV